MGLNQEILNITEVIKAAVPAERIYLFGSCAYGTPNANSDYDIFIVLPDNSIHPLEAARTIRHRLAHMKRQTPVDILANRASRFAELSLLPTLEKKVANEGVLLYESH
jgi:predicted nucleotidyltransferase